MSSSGKEVISVGNLREYVKLNVGGTLFITTVVTLTKYESMLKKMFSGEHGIKIDSEGKLID